MNIIDAPLFFQRNKAKELNDNIFANTGCFVFLKSKAFPFVNCCENYRQALYSLIIDSYVLFHDYGRGFWRAFANVSNTAVPSIIEDLNKYRILLTHSQYEPNIQIMSSFARLITVTNISSIEDFNVKLSNATDDDYKSAYHVLKKELDLFYSELSIVTDNSIKNNFCNYDSMHGNRLNVFQLSLNQALIKSILQAESGQERPNYSDGNVKYCINGKVNISLFSAVQKNIISKFKNNYYNTPDEIYPDFKNEVINTVNPAQQSSTLLLKGGGSGSGFHI